MVEFAFPTHIRQSRPGYKNPSLQLKAYPADPGLCVVTLVRENVARTQELRGSESKLLIRYVRPHHAVSKDTIARWVRTVMMGAGLDVAIFKPHSTRTAATSKAKRACVPLTDIMKHAGWSNHRTFDRFYNKPVVKDSTFADSVLKIDLCYSMHFEHVFIFLREVEYHFGQADITVIVQNSTCLVLPLM